MNSDHAFRYRHDPAYRRECREAAALYARAWKSDPFAYGRILNSIALGYEDKEEPFSGPRLVRAEAEKIMQARGERP